MEKYWKEILWQQFAATIDMFANALNTCPDELWHVPMWSDVGSQSNPPEFWYIAYHALFWLDLYLSGAAEGFTPPAPFNFDELDPVGIVPDPPYTRAQLQGYLGYCRQKCRVTIGALTDAKAQRQCTFPWGKISYAALLLDNMRHVQEHGAQLRMILGQKVGANPRWVTQAKDEDTGK